MKKMRFLLYFVCLLALATGCEENQLQWTSDQACLVYGGQKSCVDVAEGAVFLTLKDGVPQMKALKVDRKMGAALFPQYNTGTELSCSKLALSVENGKLVLADGDKKYADETGMGMLLVRGPKGQMSIRTALEEQRAIDKAAAIPIITGNATAGRWEFQRPMSQDGYLILTTIEYVIDDEGTHLIPNDTGVGVIITDNFRYEGSCNVTAPDECCAEFDASVPPLDYEDWVDDYAADGRRLLACFPNGSICTYANGLKLIVQICATGQRICLDRALCSVMISTSYEQGICISVPLDCAMENPFEN